jgi:putative ABC transport system substrate-binding protein
MLFEQLKRREFFGLVGGAALAWPSAACAQQSQQVRRIAVVHPTAPIADMSETGDSPTYSALFKELRRLGHVEGRNLIVERFSGEGRTEHYAELARDVVRRSPDLIVVTYGPLVRNFKAATTTIPIVGIMGDPVAQGIVANLARPGGNITGVSVVAGLEIWPKRLQILLEVVPTSSRVGFLASRQQWDLSQGPVVTLRQAAGQLGISLLGLPLEGPIRQSEYRRAFEVMMNERVDALIVYDQAENFTNRRLIVELAEKARLPTVYPYREYFDIGGLIAYGSDAAGVFRRAASYVDQILRGAKPGEIPIYLESKFELLLNLKPPRRSALPFRPRFSCAPTR